MAATFYLVCKAYHGLYTQFKACKFQASLDRWGLSLNRKVAIIMPSKLSITKERTAELISEYGANAQDTGNPDVQVAILSERIRNLTEHLKSHPKDNHTRRGLMMLIGKRRGLLKYIKNRDIDHYRELIKKLGIRDNI